MEIEQVEMVGVEPGKALLDLGANPRRPAVDHLLPWPRLRGVELPVDATLACDHDSVAPPANGLANRPLALTLLTVAIGCVEVGDAGVDRGSDGRHRGLPGDALAGHPGQWPTAEAQRADGNGC